MALEGLRLPWLLAGELQDLEMQDLSVEHPRERWGLLAWLLWRREAISGKAYGRWGFLVGLGRAGPILGQGHKGSSMELPFLTLCPCSW